MINKEYKVKLVIEGGLYNPKLGDFDRKVLWESEEVEMTKEQADIFLHEFKINRKVLGVNREIE